MRVKTILLLAFIILSSCAKKVNYSSEFMQQTSGKYLYDLDDVIEVYYEDEQLFLKWKGGERVEPVILDSTTFFVVDMYLKLQFVQHPETKKRYLSVIPEDYKGKITYDYPKLPDDYKTPTQYLESGEYEKALAGFMDIKKQDSTSVIIQERKFNRKGYELIRKKRYSDAIEVFKINVALYPESDNVYDSLAEAYLKSGDSLQAYNNYKKALELNTGNKRAKNFIKNNNSKFKTIEN